MKLRRDEKEHFIKLEKLHDVELIDSKQKTQEYSEEFLSNVDPLELDLVDQFAQERYHNN